ncbi:MAG: DUF2723 domain-containing protein [Chloroflexi bacterium]|nr:DUF2723 domain-containing protein [Chloroflexota bacterium]
MASVPRAPRTILTIWRSALALPAVCGFAALALYSRTLAPGLTWAHNAADGGDLLAAALTRGVPHPPGYPTYQLLLRAAIALFASDPARAGNWLSALCAAASVALMADLIRRVLPSRSWRGLVAFSAALAWAASPTLWSQAVVTEVYTLNALFVAAILWTLWRWREGQKTGGRPGAWLILAGFIFGLGMGNHVSLALLLPGGAAWLWSNRGSDCKLQIALAIAVGLSVYAYLPWAAAGNPPVNWGDPRTLERFWWLVSGQVYQGLAFNVGWAYLPGRLAAWVADALRQFGGPWAALLALVGLWRLDRGDHAWWRLTAIVGLVYSAFAVGYKSPDSHVYLIPVWAVATTWLAAGLDYGLHVGDRALQRLRRGPLTSSAGGDSRRSSRPVSYALRGLAIALLLALPAMPALRFWSEMDLSHDRAAQAYLDGVLATAQPAAIILAATDGPTFALWYAIYGREIRPDLIPINVNLYAFGWYRETLAGRHPELLQIVGGSLPLLDQFVLAAAAVQPLYRGEPLNVVLSGLTEGPAEGSLVRLVLP